MTDQTSEEKDLARSEDESKRTHQSADRRPDADEPVTNEEHDEEALEEASEKMLLREPQE